MSSITTITKPPAARSGHPPVGTLDTDAARRYTHVHPALILLLYAIQFRATVADPVSALAWGLLPLAVLQITYVAVCLPPTGAASTPPPKPGARRKQQPPSLVSRTIVPAFLSLVLAAIAGAPLLFLILVSFGAPFTTHLPHTALCALHVSLLTVLPLVYVHGVDSARWREIVGLLLPIDSVLGAALGTLLGAWVGAIPIPLDWDREWQKWPVTIVTGAYIGFVVGKLAGGTLFKGRTIKSD